jgi:hypothetical protein
VVEEGLAASIATGTVGDAMSSSTGGTPRDVSTAATSGGSGQEKGWS